LVLRKSHEPQLAARLLISCLVAQKCSFRLLLEHGVVSQLFRALRGLFEFDYFSKAEEDEERLD
jgi:hypothetical protein